MHHRSSANLTSPVLSETHPDNYMSYNSKSSASRLPQPDASHIATPSAISRRAPPPSGPAQKTARKSTANPGLPGSDCAAPSPLPLTAGRRFHLAGSADTRRMLSRQTTFSPAAAQQARSENPLQYV